MTRIQDQVGTLRRVYVRAPRAEDGVAWRSYGWHDAPDPARARQEHEAFVRELELAGAEVVLGRTAVDGDPDSIYTYDPVFLTEAGVIVLRPGKEGRRDEPEVVAADLANEGIGVVGRVEPPATVEGGDMLWLDERTLIVGRGYRTNEAGVDAIRALVPDVTVVSVDLPHLRGPDECLHLMSLLSPLDRDLVVAHLPLLPVALVETLAARGVAFVEVPEEEFSTMGPNVLALAPRVALALEGNAETRRRMEAAGVDVRTYRGDEISRKGDGGPTCLTRPLLRG